MRIALLISVVGRVKRGGESTTSGLVSFLDQHANVRVFSGGPFDSARTIDLGFPELPTYTALYDRLPSFLKHRLIRRMHYDPLSVRNLFFCKRALHHLLEDPPDLAVFRSVGPWGAKAGRRLRSSRGVPFVTIEGGWKKGERETARYSPDLHISVNVEVEEYLKSQLPYVSITSIPNGISVKAFSPQGPRASISLPRPIFMGCGLLGDVKRFHLTIKAVKQLKKGSVLLLGKGGLEAELKRLGRRELGKRFDLFSVAHEQMPAYYRASDVVTVPSSGESFGMVYLEAMSCNTPVVATRDRNRRMLVGEGGELVDPENLEAYAEALRHCADTEYGDLPRRQAGKFDWSVIGPRYLSAFEKVIDGKSRRSAHPVSRRMSR